MSAADVDKLHSKIGQLVVERDFLTEASHQLLGTRGKNGEPDIFNSDQGSQFSSGAWIDVLTDAKIKISMDEKGAWRDNRMIERLWRSLKYEYVHLNAFETGSEMRARIGRWCPQCPHSAHDILPPDEAYASKTQQVRIAA